MSDLRERLRNLRGAARPPVRRDIQPGERPPAAPLYGKPQSLESLAAGELHDTPYGDSYIVRTVHTHDHTHGDATLDGWLTQTLAGAAVFTKDQRLATIDPRKCLFLDTETTGLSAGAGTLVFLVGVGHFTDDGFEVRQYFLRNPGEEPAMLHAIRNLMEQFEALVTFNGRSFDMPLLASRYTVNRWRLQVDRWPNLDLLFPARRLWKRRLESCRLSSLESAILGVRRTGEDVPGWLIPQLYQEYLHTGDARQMHRVMYHNLYDVLSMVTLAASLCDTFARADSTALPHDDLLSLARWYEQLDLLPDAETFYNAAAKSARHDLERKQCLECLAALLKKLDRRAEAVAIWEAIGELAPRDPAPRVEIAKYYEWDCRDYERALHWTDAAIKANDARMRNWEQQNAAAELVKRRERIAEKLGKTV